MPVQIGATSLIFGVVKQGFIKAIFIHNKNPVVYDGRNSLNTVRLGGSYYNTDVVRLISYRGFDIIDVDFLRGGQAPWHPPCPACEYRVKEARLFAVFSLTILRGLLLERRSS